MMTVINDLFSLPLSFWALFFVANIMGIIFFKSQGASLKLSVISMILADVFMFWMSYQV